MRGGSSGRRQVQKYKTELCGQSRERESLGEGLTRGGCRGVWLGSEGF